MKALLLVGAAPFALPSGLAQTPLREWRLSAAPTLVIEDDGTPAKELFQVGAPWRLGDGRIVVPDGSTGELRVFDARGVYVTKFGRKGGGPGEFRVLRWVGHVGDTALVYDGVQRRITSALLSATPTVIGASALPQFDAAASDLNGRLDDGRWVVRSSTPPELRPPLGVRRAVTRIGLLAADLTGTPEWIADAQDVSVLVDAPDPARPQPALYAAPFAARLDVEATGTAVWIGDTAGDSLIRIDARTGARRVVRLPDAPVPLTDVLVEAARARELATAQSEPARVGVERKYHAAHLPRHYPVIAELVSGFGGEMWVKRRLPTAEPGGEATLPGAYVVVSALGVPVARLRVPAAFRITDVGRDYVLGVQPDADGVESVRLYALTR